MKKLFFIIIILLPVTCLLLPVHAEQLSVQQIFKKSIAATGFTKGIKGTVSLKSPDISRVVTFETNGTLLRVYKDKDSFYMDGKTVYEYTHKDSTITIERDKESELMLAPYQIANRVSKGIKRLTRKEVSDPMTVTREKSNYKISIKTEKGVLVFLINAKNFIMKSMTFMEGGKPTISITYSNITPLKDLSSLHYDQSKYPNAKIIDKRNTK